MESRKDIDVQVLNCPLGSMDAVMQHLETLHELTKDIDLDVFKADKTSSEYSEKRESAVALHNFISNLREIIANPNEANLYLQRIENETSSLSFDENKKDFLAKHGTSAINMRGGEIISAALVIARSAAASSEKPNSDAYKNLVQHHMLGIEKSLTDEKEKSEYYPYIEMLVNQQRLYDAVMREDSQFKFQKTFRNLVADLIKSSEAKLTEGKGHRSEILEELQNKLGHVVYDNIQYSIQSDEAEKLDILTMPLEELTTTGQLHGHSQDRIVDTIKPEQFKIYIDTMKELVKGIDCDSIDSKKPAAQAIKDLTEFINKYSEGIKEHEYGNAARQLQVIFKQGQGSSFAEIYTKALQQSIEKQDSKLINRVATSVLGKFGRSAGKPNVNVSKSDVLNALVSSKTQDLQKLIDKNLKSQDQNNNLIDEARSRSSDTEMKNLANIHLGR